jgi:hypothetical protein
MSLKGMLFDAAPLPLHPRTFLWILNLDELRVRYSTGSYTGLNLGDLSGGPQRPVALSLTDLEDSMSHARLSAIATATAIAATISMGALMVTRSARAQTPSRAVCTEGPRTVAEMQNWMNQQIAAGRTRFVFLNTPCAW